MGSKNKNKKTPKLIEQISGCQWWGWEVNKMGEGDQKTQTCSYKISQSWECYLQHGDYS